MVSNSQFNLVFIFFIYGLAFFSMGLLLSIEARRSRSSLEGRLFWPLAAFGFVHGLHEWMEMALEVRRWFGLAFPAWLPWARLGLLVISFSLLLYFGLQVLLSQTRREAHAAPGIGIGLFCMYALLALGTALLVKGTPPRWQEYADALTRYTLAVPGAALAAYALALQGRQLASQDRNGLSTSFRLAASFFALYGLTQLVVPPIDIFPAAILNTSTFLELTGFAIQVVRAILAVGITVSLIRAIQIMDDERRRQLAAAQQERMQALEQVQLDLVEREAMRRELLRHTVIAQEEERARIARELHDETAQFLTALSLGLATLRKSLPDAQGLKEMMDRLQSLSGQMSRGIYRMVHDLRPAQLDDLGLVAALQHLAEEERKRSGLQVSLQLKASKMRLDPLIETVLFRVAQEALTNAARHSRSDQATVRLDADEQFVTLQVQDNGVGFALARAVGPPQGYGLAGMRERAESVGGELNIQTSSGRGTLIEVKVPILVGHISASEEAVHEYHPLDIG